MKTTRYITAITIMVLCIVTIGWLYTNLPEEKVHPLRENEVKTVELEVQPKEVDKKQLQCLADNIYYEAGGESTEGKAAVARVVLNRITHGGFGSTPCKVIYQATHVKQINEETEQAFWVKMCQFSWVCEGKGNPNRNSTRYQNSLQVAQDVLIYDMYQEVIPKTVLFFHNKSVVNQWPHEVVKVIGNHIFYTKKKVKHAKQKPYRYNKKSTEALVHPTVVPGET